MATGYKTPAVADKKSPKHYNVTGDARERPSVHPAMGVTSMSSKNC
jgi:hypothetical protein